MTLKPFTKIAVTLMILTSCGDTTGHGGMTPAEKLALFFITNFEGEVAG